MYLYHCCGHDYEKNYEYQKKYEYEKSQKRYKICYVKSHEYKKSHEYRKIHAYKKSHEYINKTITDGGVASPTLLQTIVMVSSNLKSLRISRNSKDSREG